MLLNKIRLKGFKSFADEVELELDRGIIAVVGPNGCGKSNIADSINWALGEQSPTSLRGKKMEQMIFNGSSSRKAMGMAEVTLTLRANGQATTALDLDTEGLEELERDGTGLVELLRGTDGEITITRRMFRDTQSEYLLNGRICRLKDIQDLLMALGIGTRAITIVEQDRIASIINARPVDRRVLIEDAAGITKFKLNRHLTQIKLEHARQNLEQIDVLLGEQETNVRSLRRQAAKARRFMRIQEEIREIESRIIATRYFELIKQQKDVAGKIGEFEEKLASATAALTTVETREAELSQNLDELTGRKVQTREKYYQSNLEIDRDTNRLKHLRDGMEDLFNRSEEAGVRLQESKAQLTDRKKRLTRLQKSIAQSESEIGSAADKLSKLREQADFADVDLKDLQGKREELTGKLGRMREERVARVSSLEAIGKEEKRLAQAMVNARAILDKTAASISEVEDRIKQFDVRQGDLAERKLAVEAEMERARQNQKDVKQELIAVDRRSDTLKKSRGSAEATLAALQEMEERHEGVEESAKAILDNSDLSSVVEPLGIVADWIEIDPEFSTPAVAAYGHLLEAVVVKDESAADKGIKLLQKKSIGRAGFVPLERPASSGFKTKIANDLRKAIKSRGEHGDSLLALFPPAALAESISEAISASAEHPEVVFATKEGTAVLNGGLIRGGGDSLSKQIFTRRARMEELKKEVKILSAELQEILKHRDELLENERKIAGDMDRLRSETEQLRLQEVELGAQSTAASEEKERLQEYATATEKEFADFSDQKTTAVTRLKETESNISALEDDIERAIGELAELDELLKEKSEAAGQARRKEHELQTDVSTAEERLKAARDAEQSLKSDHDEVQTRIDSTEKELHAIEEQRLNALQEIETIESGMQAKMEASKQLASDLNQLDGELDQLASKRKVNEQEVKQLRKQEAAAREELEEYRLQAREQMVNLQNLLERAEANLNIKPEEISSYESEGEEMDYEASRERLQTLREKLEAMGGVNLLAAEEYDRQYERFQNLSNQRQDVVDSIDSLEKVIDRIDKISRKRFREAFEMISENFHRTFRVIFGGGKAELMLAEGDLLSAGIEIIVQPPGKRPQSASLLSGGEKSLSAFSLIMAVMEYRPTPFCVLDESDAALDDSNIRRVASLLRQRAENTQFIIVTHNKSTMEIADQLYGVTMEEPGISRIVSVKFN